MGADQGRTRVGLGQLHYLSSFVELGVSDVDAAVRWYADVLGFHEIARYDGAVHLRRGEGQDVVLREGEGTRLHFATNLDLAELARAAREAGSERVYTPAAGSDNPETLAVRDPDGNVVRFFTRQAPGPLRT